MRKTDWVATKPLSFHVESAEEANSAWKTYPEGYILEVLHFGEDELFSHYYKGEELNFTGVDDVDYVFYTGEASVTYLPGWWVIYRSFVNGLTLEESVHAFRRMAGGWCPQCDEYYMLTYGGETQKYSDEYYNIYDQINELLFG
jgi:hypothetical protein